MKRIELFLIDHDEIRLDEFRFHPGDASPTLVTLCGGSPIYCMSGSRNTFAWSAGVRALTILLLKMALNRPGDLSLIGHIGSPAATLDYALSKEPKWLEDFFGVTAQGHSQAKNLFGRRNSERKRPGPVEVFGSNRHLPPEAIQVYLNGELQSSATLPALISALECEFGSGKGRGRSMKRELERRNQQRSMHRLELHLSNNGELRLDEFRFFDPETAETLITTNASSSTTSSGEKKNLFNWTNGVKALTLLLLRAASSGAPGASLVGESGSLAASLDYALSREPAWLIDFFGMTSNGRAAARRYLGRRNAERRRPGPVEVYVVEELLNFKSIFVFGDGKRMSGSELEALVTALGRTACFESVHLRSSNKRSVTRVEQISGRAEDDYPLIARKRVLTQRVNLETGIAVFSLYSRYVNHSDSPVTFLHYNLLFEPQSGFQGVRLKCPLEDRGNWKQVIGTDGLSRLLVQFEKPLLPGLEREETLSFEMPNSYDLDSGLFHTVLIPTEFLTLEAIFPEGYNLTDTAILAERGSEFLYTRLPRVARTETKCGCARIRWTMKNPPQGFRFRLMWGIEARAEKHVELPLDSAIPAILN